MITAEWIEDHKELADTVTQLAKLRKELGIPQHVIAGEMNTTQGVISALELMKHNTKVYTFMTYARQMGKRIRFVLEDIDSFDDSSIDADVG